MGIIGGVVKNKEKGKSKIGKLAVKDERIVGEGRKRIHSIVVGRTVVALDRNMLGVDGGNEKRTRGGRG